MKKREVIKLVNESAASMFTKDDVINLINKIGEGTSVNLNTLLEDVLMIITDSDTNLIEVDNNNCSFKIRNGNEVEVDDVDFDANDYLDDIKSQISELFDNLISGDED